MSGEARTEGIVVSLVSQGCVVEYQGAQFRCVIRGIRKFGKREIKNLLAVGDVVTFTLTGGGQGAIEDVLERRTALVREASGTKWPQVVAANADQVMIIASHRDPPFRPGIVDRICVAAEAGGLVPLLCINKADLVPEDEREDAGYLSGTGYRIIHASAASGCGIGEVKAALEGKTTVLLGHSGVGKSSLLKAVKPDLDLRVAPVSRKTGKGRHTTTAPRMFGISAGTRIIDTPGIREFKITGIAVQDVWRYYPDFVALAGSCGMHGCVHRGEPDCAVTDAVVDGRVHPVRYEGYIKIIQSLEVDEDDREGRYFTGI